MGREIPLLRANQFWADSSEEAAGAGAWVLSVAEDCVALSESTVGAASEGASGVVGSDCFSTDSAGCRVSGVSELAGFSAVASETAGIGATDSGTGALRSFF